MNDIKSRLIQSAIETFSQYGVKKTSMADIAERAGVSRQTLYINFENKDEMLAAAMISVIDGILENLESQWRKSDSIEDKLNAYFESSTIPIFNMLESQPDAKDLILGVGEHSHKVAKDCEKKKIRLLTDELLPHADQLKKSATTPKDVSTFVVHTSTNFIYTVDTRRELKGLIATLKNSVLAMVGQ